MTLLNRITCSTSKLSKLTFGHMHMHLYILSDRYYICKDFSKTFCGGEWPFLNIIWSCSFTVKGADMLPEMFAHIKSLSSYMTKTCTPKSQIMHESGEKRIKFTTHIKCSSRVISLPPQHYKIICERILIYYSYFRWLSFQNSE